MLRPVRIALTLPTISERAIELAGEALARANEDVLRATPGAPGLWDAAVVYQLEPQGEDWYGIPELLQRGAGDCEDLAAAEVAYLRVRGAAALLPGDPLWPIRHVLHRADIGFRVQRTGDSDYHCVVHVTVDGQVWEDDPSARLGMIGRLFDPLILSHWRRLGARPRVMPREAM
jgi:hypothetical protein